MIVKLVVIKGQDQGKIFYVREGAKKILGRSTKTDITLRDAGVSRLHCEIRDEGESAMIADMNSKNGTSVNGQRIVGPRPLQDRDRIGIGATVIEARLEAAPQSDTAPLQPAGAESEGAAGEASAPAAADRTPDARADAPSGPREPGGIDEEAADALFGTFDAWLEEPAAPHQAPEANAPVFRFAGDEQAPLPDTEAETEAPEPRVGMTIGGCLIEEYVGRDDLCRTYRGVQVSMERAVTVKILDPKAARDERALKRFLQAAQSGGRLSHPNIVQVYDAGKEHDLNYIVLEHLDGHSVQGLLRSQGRGKPLPVGQALDIADQILGALEHAHEHNAIHGNIRIDNVYVTRHDVAKLAELGFEKAPPEDTARRAEMYFAAPEQLDGASGIDARTDIYSIGAVTYVMLTGHLPFPTRNPAQALERIRRGEFEPMQNLNPSVPEHVQKAVEKAMSPSPDDRFQSAAEMRSALRRAG